MKKVVYAKEKYPRLQAVAVNLADRVAMSINRIVNETGEARNVSYPNQLLLELTIQELESRV